MTTPAKPGPDYTLYTDSSGGQWWMGPRVIVRREIVRCAAGTETVVTLSAEAESGLQIRGPLPPFRK